MIAVGTSVIAWTATLGPMRGIVRGNSPLPNGRRLYLIDVGDNIAIEIDDIAVFDATNLPADSGQMHREAGRA